MSKGGFVKLDRGIFKNFLWNEAREFSKAEAWIDLIQLAEVSDDENGGFKNGQLVYMPNRFSKNWMWKLSKVKSFLKKLESENMITIESGIISILNFNQFVESSIRATPFDSDYLLKRSSIDFKRDTIVYVIQLTDKEEDFVKIGIAFNLNERIREYKYHGYLVSIIKVIEFKNRHKALNEEVSLHRKFIKFKYVPLKKFGGFSECFSLKILNEI